MMETTLSMISGFYLLLLVEVYPAYYPKTTGVGSSTSATLIGISGQWMDSYFFFQDQ